MQPTELYIVAIWKDDCLAPPTFISEWNSLLWNTFLRKVRSSSLPSSLGASLSRDSSSWWMSEEKAGGSRGCLGVSIHDRMKWQYELSDIGCYPCKSTIDPMQ